MRLIPEQQISRTKRNSRLFFSLESRRDRSGFWILELSSCKPNVPKNPKFCNLLYLNCERPLIPSEERWDVISEFDCTVIPCPAGFAFVCCSWHCVWRHAFIVNIQNNILFVVLLAKTLLFSEIVHNYGCLVFAIDPID